MTELNKENLKEIHELALAIAECTKGKTNIYEVAEDWMKRVIAPADYTPAALAMSKDNVIANFFDELIDSVWMPKDFNDPVFNPEDFDEYRKQ